MTQKSADRPDQSSGRGKGLTRTRRDVLRLLGGAGAAGIGFTLAGGLRHAIGQSRPQLDPPTISCIGASDASVSIRVCAGATGAVAGFSIHWVKRADYDATGWDSPGFCAASFSGAAPDSPYDLGPGECVDLALDGLPFDDGVGGSSPCASPFECATEYAFRAFAHGNRDWTFSEFSETIFCSTLACAPQTFPLSLTPTRCDLFPNASKKIHVEGAFTLAGDSDGIDPVIDSVALRLAKLSGSIYPVGTDFMPVAFTPSTDGWRLTDAEKARTGLQAFAITRTADPREFHFKLVDAQAGLPQSDYSQTELELVIGNDVRVHIMRLVQTSNGLWRLG